MTISALWHRAAPTIVGLALTLGLAGIGLAAVDLSQHSSTLQRISVEQTQIAQLQKVNAQKAKDAAEGAKELESLARWLIAVEVAQCQAVNAACPPVPLLPLVPTHN